MVNMQEVMGIFNRKEQSLKLDNQKKVIELLNRFKGELAFSSEDERIWESWADFKKRDFRDLRDILTGNYKVGFKKRALFAALVPHHQWIPFKWMFDIGSQESYLFLQGMELKRLEVNLLRFATKLIRQFKQLLEDNPSVVKDPTEALFAYNNYLIQLLSLLPADEKEEVFNSFSLNDARVYWNMDTASGYNPFGSLLWSAGIEETYKKRADDKMRPIISAELRGEVTPRAEHEEAVKCYAYIIQLLLYSEDNLPYSIELFADQVDFIVSLKNCGDKRLINAWDIGKLFNLLAEDRFRGVRHRIARFVLFCNGEFSVCSQEIMAASEKMLAEFGAEDDELRLALERIVADGRQRIDENKEAQQKHRSAEEAIISRMLV